MEDLITSLNNLNLKSPFEQMRDGLFSADLANIIATIESLAEMMTSVKDTRNEMVKCYSEVLSNRHKIYINPSNCAYLAHFQSHDPVIIFQTVFFHCTAQLAKQHSDFRSKAMNLILEHAIELNHPLYLWRLDHKQLVVAAAWFILWLSYHSVLEGRISSMLSDEVQTQLIAIFTRICDDQSAYYPADLIHTIQSLRA